MARIAVADLLIAGILFCPARVARPCLGHAFYVVEYRLDPPKTTAGEDSGLQLVGLCIRSLCGRRGEVCYIDLRIRGRGRGNAAADRDRGREDDTELYHK